MPRGMANGALRFGPVYHTERTATVTTGESCPSVAAGCSPTLRSGSPCPPAPGDEHESMPTGDGEPIERTDPLRATRHGQFISSPQHDSRGPVRPGFIQYTASERGQDPDTGSGEHPHVPPTDRLIGPPEYRLRPRAAPRAPPLDSFLAGVDAPVISPVQPANGRLGQADGWHVHLVDSGPGWASRRVYEREVNGVAARPLGVRGDVKRKAQEQVGSAVGAPADYSC